jgi:hypothetical protein
MNKELYDWFHSLTDNEVVQLSNRYADSPVALLLIRFLKSGIKPNFRSSDAVNYLYKKELEKEPYGKLQNRYFKLRKKLLSFYKTNTSELDLLMTPEELTFFKCRQLIQKNEIVTAQKTLLELEKHCWEQNIFELLPNIIGQIIYCFQAYQRFEDTVPYFEKQAKAAKLYSNTKMMHSYFAQGYQKVVKSSYSAISSEMQKIKALKDANTDYPRFKMSYHFYALALGSGVNGNTLKALIRHLNAFNRLKQKYPDMPVDNFRPFYKENNKAYLLGRQMAISFHKGDVESAYQHALEHWQLLNKGKGYLKQSEREYFNFSTLQLYTGRIKEAEKTGTLLLEHYKKNNLREQFNHAYRIIAECYSHDFSQQQHINPIFYIRKLDELIKSSSGPDLAQAYYVKAKFSLTYSHFRAALTAIEAEECKNVLISFNIYDEMLLCFQTLSSKSNRSKLATVKQSTQRKFREKGQSIQAIYELKWAISALDHRLNS